MKIIINNSSMEPIYEQIVGQIKSLILHGELKEETMLPSVRALSRELQISALTVKKAYDHLEQEGFIITVHGKGSFVARHSSVVWEEQRRLQVEEQMEQAIRSGRSAGMTEEELRELFELILSDGEKTENSISSHPSDGEKGETYADRNEKCEKDI